MRIRRSTHVPLLTAAAVLTSVLSACSPGAVPVEPPRPDPGAAEACARLSAALPDALDGHDRRRTEPASRLTAAWGDPAIVLRCGVGVPAAYRPTSQLITVNGVDWLPEQLTGGYLFTSIGRVAGVELSVPDDYRPEVNPLADLSLVVSQEVPPRPPAESPGGSASATPSSAPAPTR